MAQAEPSSRLSRALRHWPWAAAALSGLLLATAFPGFAWSESAWIALVPLILSLRAATPRNAFWLGYLAGTVFWLVNIYWIWNVTLFGWILLSGYCSIYTAIFAWFTQRWFAWTGAASWARNLGYVVIAPAVWVTLEYLRSHLFTGFTWNTLAISQYDVMPLRQIAQWGGVYMISAVLVCFNAGVATTLLRYREAHTRPGRSAHPELIVGFLVMAIAMTLGIRVMRSDRIEATPVQIGMVQPSIPQIDKWTDETEPLIYRRLTELTAAVEATNRVDLIVWPETALPDDVRYSERSWHFVNYLTRTGTPLLVGSMDYVVDPDSSVRYYNSSFLFNTGGEITGYYDKRHLVMFGEYIPFQGRMPFIRALTPNLASFTPGKTNEVFYLRSPEIPFTPLICFEDSIPGLARDSVRAGARLLINQTNDAWFERSSAARQHMAHCVFRCVENRVPAVRCANTGVSCFIDHLGRVRSRLVGENGDPFGPGFLTGWVLVPRTDMTPTFYTLHGDRFARILSLLGGGALLIALLPTIRSRLPARRRTKRTAAS